MTTYTNPFTGQTVSPSQVAYESLTISADTVLQWPVNGNTGVVASNIIEVTATTTSLNLIMPSALQVSVGQAVIIRNIGTNTFTVTDNPTLPALVGSTLVSIPSGITIYLYLTANTTNAGTWQSVTFGAGTSSANAATLAGYGLTALGTTLNQSYLVTNYYSNGTLTATNRANFVVWSSGVGTLTLTSAATLGNNWFCMIANNGTGIVTITPSGTDTINGNANQQLQLTESLVIVSNGAGGFNTFGYGRSNAFAYTQFSQSVTGGTFTLTSAQASNTIQTYIGALTSNQTVIVPSTVQLYTFTNNTTGAYSFTVKTVASGGATVLVPQSSSLVIICDGTNCYNAASGSSSSLTTLTLGNGSLSVPSLKFSGDINSGIFLPSSSQVGFVVANTLAGYFNASGFTAINGIGGGAF